MVHGHVQRLLGVRPCRQYLDTEGRFRGDSTICAVGFSIGSKGYIGTGEGYNGHNGLFTKTSGSTTLLANTWTQKADFGGTARYGAVGFSIGSKGYIGTGSDDSSLRYKDFWEYDPAANTWTQKADFGGTARDCAVGFSIGSKGYIGTGEDDSGDDTEISGSMTL